MAFSAAVGFVAYVAADGGHSTLRGVATRVIDGDTLEIAGRSVRLWGIDAPEMPSETGLAAKLVLSGIAQGLKLSCMVRGRDRYARTVAQCFLPDGRDLAAEMVRLGHAKDWPAYSGGYYSTVGR